MARRVQLIRGGQAAAVENKRLNLFCVHPVQDRVSLSLQYRDRGQSTPSKTITIICMIRWTAVTTLPSLLTASRTHFSECFLMGFLSVSLSPWRPFSQTGEENQDETKYLQSDPEQHAAPPASQCPPVTWAWDSSFSS